MTITLDWFMQHFPTDSTARDEVRVHLLKTDDDGDVSGKDLILSNDALIAHAVASKRTTWDETDVAALAGLVLARPITVQPATTPDEE